MLSPERVTVQLPREFVVQLAVPEVAPLKETVTSTLESAACVAECMVTVVLALQLLFDVFLVPVMAPRCMLAAGG